MPFRAVLGSSLSLLSVAIVFAACGELRPTHNDAKEAFAELVVVQKAHQASIADIALDRAPQYREIIQRDTALTLALWRRRQLQFEYLIDHDPDRLRLRRGREGLVSFAWTTQDSTLLAQANPAYVRYEHRIAGLKRWLAEHKWQDEDVVAFYDDLERTVEIKSLRRIYGRDEQAIVLRYRLSAILKEE